MSDKNTPENTELSPDELLPFENVSRLIQSLKKEPPAQARSVIQAAESGVLVGGTFEEQYRLAKAYSASGLMPKALNTPEKVLVALQMCRELNLPAMTSIGKIMVLNGTPSIFGELPLALVYRSGLLESILEMNLLAEGGAVIGVQCLTKRKGMSGTVGREFTIEDAKNAGLWGKPGPWTQYPKRMLQLRARAWNLKDVFPDILMGVGIAEYDEYSESAPKVSGVVEELNETYSQEGSKTT